MLAARRPLVPGLLLVLLAACALGCSGPTTAATGAYLVRPGPDAAMDPDIGTYDASRVDAAFTEALGELIREVRALELLDDTARQARMPDAIARLADAIDRIPKTSSDPRVREAVALIRSDRALVASPGSTAGAHALLVASSALLHVADEQYAESPIVEARARALRETVERMRDDPRLRRSTERMLTALREAARVLTAIHGSLAWGTVR